MHLRCFTGDGLGLKSSNHVHALAYPDCPTDWHDMYDHPSITGTRAGIAWQFGLWGMHTHPCGRGVATGGAAVNFSADDLEVTYYVFSRFINGRLAAGKPIPAAVRIPDRTHRTDVRHRT